MIRISFPFMSDVPLNGNLTAGFEDESDARLGCAAPFADKKHG